MKSSIVFIYSGNCAVQPDFNISDVNIYNKYIISRRVLISND